MSDSEWCTTELDLTRGDEVLIGNFGYVVPTKVSQLDRQARIGFEFPETILIQGAEKAKGLGTSRGGQDLSVFKAIREIVKSVRKYEWRPYRPGGTFS